MPAYPSDEFDDLEPTGRKGAHRRGTPISQTGALVLIAVLAIAALLVVFGAFNIIRSSTSDPEEKVAEETTPEASAEPSADPSETEVAVVDKTADVTVLNASGVTGAAAKFRDHLESAGWNVAEVGNHKSAGSASVVHYSSDEFEMQAGALAAELGVTKVEKSSEFRGQITLVIASDIAEKDLDSGGSSGGASDGASAPAGSNG